MTTIDEVSPIRLMDRLQAPGSLCLECGQETQDSKPYCPAHVYRMPYVSDLLALLEPRAGESAA